MQLQVFKYEEEDHLDNLTTVEIDGDVWFVANEVCNLLEIKNTSDAVSRLDDDENLLSVIPIAGQNRNVSLISESGLYALVFKSNKPSAKKFRKWVTKEVIPTIRKTGGFGINRLETPNFVKIYYFHRHKRRWKCLIAIFSALFTLSVTKRKCNFKIMVAIIPKFFLSSNICRIPDTISKLCKGNIAFYEF